MYRLLWRHLLLQKFDGQAGEIARSIDDGDEPAARKFSFRNSSAPGCVHAGEEPAMLRQIRFGSKGDMPGTTASGANRPFGSSRCWPSRVEADFPVYAPISKQSRPIKAKLDVDRNFPELRARLEM